MLAISKIICIMCLVYSSNNSKYPFGAYSMIASVFKHSVYILTRSSQQPP